LKIEKDKFSADQDKVGQELKKKSDLVKAEKDPKKKRRN